MAKPARKRKKEPVTDAEKARLRALKLVGHDFAIGKDQHKRERLVKTATCERDYDIGNDRSVVRVRNVDPLKGMSSLTWQQRAAGKRYREEYEICQREGVKTGSWEIRVDGDGGDRDRPERITDAHRSLDAADFALGYGEIKRIMIMVVGEGMSVKALSELDRNPREAVSKLLTMGLSKLVEHYDNPQKALSAKRRIAAEMT